MSLREIAYYSAHELTGMPIGREYKKLLGEEYGNYPDITRQNLIELLSHCQQYVPYYADLMKKEGNSFHEDPEAYLCRLPILTKELIRQNMDRLTSTDLSGRKWYYNSSGGSTGEPLRLIQDRQFAARSGAVQFLSFHWAGREFGEQAVRVWGSERDILQGSMGIKMKLLNWLTNDRWMNAFRMTPETMRQFLEEINDRPPRLLVAYVQSIYELAKFAQQTGIQVTPQNAIMTSAGTLYPFIRQTLQDVFQCPVYNRYGSREAGDMASECQAHQGLHIFPWSSYIEIVDDDGQSVPNGAEGNILVTCLTNYAMPLVRFSIGDRGALLPVAPCACGRHGAKLEKITGRNVDLFRRQDGAYIDGEYFTHLLYFRNWVKKFQVIQKSYHEILYQVVPASIEPDPGDMNEIVEKTKHVMGQDCQVRYEFVADIPASASGKYRYTITEIND